MSDTRPPTHPELIESMQREAAASGQSALLNGIAAQIPEPPHAALCRREYENQVRAQMLAEDAADLCRLIDIAEPASQRAIAKALASIALSLAFQQ